MCLCKIRASATCRNGSVAFSGEQIDSSRCLSNCMVFCMPGVIVARPTHSERLLVVGFRSNLRRSCVLSVCSVFIAVWLCFAFSAFSSLSSSPYL